MGVGLIRVFGGNVAHGNVVVFLNGSVGLFQAHFLLQIVIVDVLFREVGAQLFRVLIELFVVFAVVLVPVLPTLPEQSEELERVVGVFLAVVFVVLVQTVLSSFFEGELGVEFVGCDFVESAPELLSEHGDEDAGSVFEEGLEEEQGEELGLGRNFFVFDEKFQHLQHLLHLGLVVVFDVSKQLDSKVDDVLLRGSFEELVDVRFLYLG